MPVLTFEKIGARMNTMKKMTVLILSLVLFACAPVLNRDLMQEGERNPSLDHLKADPSAYEGKLFILGGVIVETRLVQDGTQIEILGFPVDTRGYLEDGRRAKGRFIAVYPREKGLLDPVIYKKGRVVTVAATFTGKREGKIDELDYVFPVFRIRQIHLWDDEDYGYYPYRYPYWYYPYAYPYYPYYWGPGPWPPWW